MFHRLERVCVVVEPGPDPSSWWRRRLGCTTDGGVATYQQVPGVGALGQGKPPPAPGDGSDFQIEVRSGADPYMAVRQVTHGTMRFAASPGQLRVKAGLFLALACLAAPNTCR